ncbi:hypothetical protein J6TS2_23100 [Heyndrickxia sporothermodurans]|nr:hypothetical protein J6TS2_23100 [Heyndrickxia sporothermodurans]
MWSQLPYSFKRDVLIKIADLYTDESIEIQGQVRDVMEQYPQIIKYANCFSANNGANCLAATLAAATEEIQRSEWIIHQWIHPETFKLGLKLRGYEEVEITLNHLLPKDVLVWGINNIHHTAFHLGDGLFFNKNGQFFFNSWQILAQDVLLKIWGNQDIRVYRKISSHY